LLAGSLGDIIMCDWCPMERETLFTDSKERRGWLEVVLSLSDMPVKLHARFDLLSFI